MKSKPLNEIEKKLIVILLTKASEEFSRHCCNDFSFWKNAGIPIQESEKLNKAMHEWNGDPEEYDPKYADHTADFFIMSYLAARVRDLLSENSIKTMPKGY